MRPALIFIALLLMPLSAFPADVFRFKADKMAGGRATGREKTLLQGHAEVRADDLLIQADSIELSGKDNRFLECLGAVSGQDDKKGIRFTTKKLKYDRVLKLALLEGDSVMEDKTNAVVAKGRFIEYNDAAGTILLQVAVRIFKGEMVCRSDYALYRREEKNLELSGLPVVFKDGDEFRSDRMKVDLETDEISMEGSVSGSLSGTSKDSPPAGVAPVPAAPSSGESPPAPPPAVPATGAQSPSENTP